MSISHLRKLAKKSLIPGSLVCLTTASPFSTFPNLPASAYYDDLSNTARHKRDLSKLRYLLNKRVRDHCFNTTSTFKFITNSETSLSILADLIQTLAPLDNGFPRKSAFDALIAVPASSNGCLTRKKNMERSWRLIEIMAEPGILPDITTLNYLLTAYCFKGDLTAANGVVKRIEEEGLGVDSRAYDVPVLDACKEGKMEGTLVVLRRMECRCCI
ncbi:PREDICTED: pentatricopeptide repeat-containing protein At2g40240, mitochondrial-like [Populus euphratica]|uniref:Pentatricopeptide repeat-containing protein At2g40240, mitochondrial-like n=1 Tax=Populus euphratica TaxID=75702 RepID=A0AAJ6U9X6_POPEU|nr:PREDICTED: pentatricopeptide repeat-containing protein At2g40240, mitochondrial-like [Populus euphratica]